MTTPPLAARRTRGVVVAVPLSALTRLSWAASADESYMDSAPAMIAAIDALCALAAPAPEKGPPA